MTILTAPDVAQTLQISTSKVYEMWRTRELPCVRMGASVRMSLEALEQWVATNHSDLQQIACKSC